jgi:hypothetical protein
VEREKGMPKERAADKRREVCEEKNEWSVETVGTQMESGDGGTHSYQIGL